MITNIITQKDYRENRRIKNPLLSWHCGLEYSVKDKDAILKYFKKRLKQVVKSPIYDRNNLDNYDIVTE